MSILILNRGPLALRPYHEWFADYPGPLLLLTSRQDLERLGERLPTKADGYLVAEAFADYETGGGTVEARVMQLAREHSIEHIIACQERDLERAGLLRDKLGLSGQGHASALAFRNKLVMKELAAAAGIRVADHAPVETATDIREFVEVHGYPLVVKERDGFSSVGMRILRSRAELEEYLVSDFARSVGSPPNLLVEAFVQGTMHHVDGIVLDGRVVVAWPSRYLYQLESFARDSNARLDVALDPEDPLGQRLLAFADRILDALPTPEHTTFHAEVFHTPQDDLVMCEIASRNGGALIKSVLEAMFHVNLPTAWPRACVGLPVPLPRDGSRMTPTGTAGQLLLLKRAGVVHEIPDAPPFPWLERYERYVERGQRSVLAASSGDFMVAMVVSAPDRLTCEARLRQAAEWFESRLVIEPVSELESVR